MSRGAARFVNALRRPHTRSPALEGQDLAPLVDAQNEYDVRCMKIGTDDAAYLRRSEGIGPEFET